MRAVALAAGVAFAAGCQPLYGGKAEKIANPRKKKRPPDKEEAKPEIKYVEDCTANFRDDPTHVLRNVNGSNTLVAAGDERIAQAKTASDTASQIEMIRAGIDKYRSALLKDPYNAQATLKLAIAYDKVYRKGCALKLLARIAQLEGNTKFHDQAKRAADLVSDTPEWFRGYRSDAVQAVGR